MTLTGRSVGEGKQGGQGNSLTNRSACPRREATITHASVREADVESYHVNGNAHYQQVNGRYYRSGECHTG